MNLRVGHGYDLHLLVPGRPFLLGGVEIPSERGPDGHSDADLLVHAVIDALFGAAALGDIGTHFPDSDSAWKGASGATLLDHTMQILGERRIVNVDTTIVTEIPRISPYKQAIRKRLASMLGIAPNRVSVKATTNEKCDSVGAGDAVVCFAVVLLEIPDGIREDESDYAVDETTWL